MRNRKILLSVSLVALLAMTGLACAGPSKNQTSRRAILYIIDGLAAEAPDRIDMPEFNALRSQGTYYKETYLVQPAHPHSGEWAAMYSSSIPNPVMLAGTLFLTPGQKLISQCFGDRITAHATNSLAYVSLDHGYSLSYMKSGQDSDALRWARHFLKEGGAEFIRIHLQSLGGAGTRSYQTEENVPWKNNIWAKNSPYRVDVQRADRELGQFIRWLKEERLYNSSYLFITSDHGQADIGWHPPLEEGGWRTPLLIIGPGIKKGRQFDYAESIDITPTIAHLMAVDPPENVLGRVLHEALIGSGENNIPPERNVKILDFLLRDAENLFAELEEKAADRRSLTRRIEKLKADFYNIDRFVQWSDFDSIQDLIEHNQTILENLHKIKEQL